MIDSTTDSSELPAAPEAEQAAVRGLMQESPEDWKNSLAKLWHYMDHCHLPRKKERPRWLPEPYEEELVAWLRVQRVLHADGQLLPVHARLLRVLHLLPAGGWPAPAEAPAVPFVRKVGASPAWEIRYAELAAFHAEHGHCKVSTSCPEKLELARWVNSQRGNEASGGMSAERHSRLEALGLQWRTKNQDAVWDEHFQGLVAYQKEHGHMRVMMAEDDMLWGWIATQRTFYRRGILKPARRCRLDDIGFAWKAVIAVRAGGGPGAEQRWERMCELLEKCISEEGPGCIQTLCAQTSALGCWLWSARANARTGKLRPEWCAKLAALGALAVLKDPQPEPRWQARYAMLRAFYQENGHTRAEAPMNDFLRTWCHRQRVARKLNELRTDLIPLLDALGFEWETQTALSQYELRRKELQSQLVWNRSYEKLQLYHREHGHCNVPFAIEGKKGLHRWSIHQRNEQNRGRLSPERAARLNELGFRWAKVRRDSGAAWEAGYAALKAFHQEHGHTRVMKNAHSSLYHWRHAQWQRLVEGRLSAEQIAKLEALGFRWVAAKYGKQPIKLLLKSRAERHWDRNCRKLEAYHRRHGDCDVPIESLGDVRLRAWMNKQRILLKGGELSQDQMARLAKLDFR